MAKTFVLSDSSVPNSYGFYVDHETLDTSRFDDNPVLLYMHKRGEVHGYWKNLTFSGTQWLGDPEFDMPDPASAHIAGKVERNVLKGASIYLAITPNTLFVKDDQDRVWIKNAEVFEASVVDIPSNKKTLSVKIFENGKELSQQEVEGYMLSAGNSEQPVPVITIQSEKSDMSKLLLNAATVGILSAYGLQNADLPEEVDKAVNALNVKLTAILTALDNEKKLHAELKATVKSEKDNAFKALLDKAKLTAEERKDYEELAEVKYDLAFRQVEKLVSSKTSLSELVEGKKLSVEGREKWSYAEWQEKAPEELELMFDQEPERFNHLFGAK